MAYEQLEPFGPLEEARYAGMIVAAVYNCLGGGGNGQPVRIEEVFPQLAEDAPNREQSPEQIGATLTAFAAAQAAASAEHGNNRNP